MRPSHTRTPARLALAFALGLAGAGSALAPTAAQAAGPDDEEVPRRSGRRTFDESGGAQDPRKADLPRKHRLRLGVTSSYIRLSAAQSSNSGRTERFHYAPLMLDVGYQLQFLRYMMFRPALAVGANVANSRYAMPIALSPRAFFGYQGRLFGFALGYVYYSPLDPLITVENGSDGRSGSIGGPIIRANHSVQGELSFTSRIDRVALYFALGAGATRTKLRHFSLAIDSWRFTMSFSAGVFFDGTLRRAKRAAREDPSGSLP